MKFLCFSHSVLVHYITASIIGATLTKWTLGFQEFVGGASKEKWDGRKQSGNPLYLSLMQLFVQSIGITAGFAAYHS